MRRLFFFIGLLTIALGTALPVFAQNPKAIDLWPGEIPGGLTEPTGEEKDMSKPADNLVGGKPLIRLGNVSKPTLTVYRPRSSKAADTTVLVCPGGGYTILALDLEGTEVCEWLNSIGVTAVLLKYRVPTRTGDTNHVAPLQDAQRAMGLLRQSDARLQVPTNHIGVIGFSAGGHLAANLSNARQRQYAEVDAADRRSSQPDFVILIHPGYLVTKENPEKIAPELAIGSSTPPTFIAMTQDDPVKVENALFYFLALKKAGIPSELHVYPTGGHGYGLRRTEHFVTTWPDRAADWMRSRKLLREK